MAIKDPSVGYNFFQKNILDKVNLFGNRLE